MSYKIAKLDHPGPYPSDPTNFATGINDSGQIIGEGRASAGPAGWIGYLDNHGSFSYAGASFVGDINNTGQIVGNTPPAFGMPRHGFISGQPQYDYPGSAWTVLDGNNDNGDVVGTYGLPGGESHMFKLTSGTATLLPDPHGAVSSRVMDINNTKNKVGFFIDEDGAQHGFILTKGKWTPVDVPGSLNTVVLGINDQYKAVGSYQDQDGSTHGFIRSPLGVFKTFDMPGSTATSAYSINNNGDIVGAFVNASGEHGFLASQSLATILADLGPKAVMKDLMPAVVDDMSGHNQGDWHSSASFGAYMSSEDAMSTVAAGAWHHLGS